jgi:hypothetical protein
MKVLEIYSNYCWSFQSESPTSLARMRNAVRVADERDRTAQLEEIRDGQAYLFVGDPLNVDFARGFFDEITVDAEVSPVKTTLLRPRTKRWAKADATVHLPKRLEETGGQTYIPLRQRLFRLAVKQWSRPQAVRSIGG